MAIRLPPITTQDGRKAWSFLAVLGGCLTMTVFAAVGVWLVRESAGLSFWLALAAHCQIALGLGVFGAQFVKRSYKVSKDSFSVEDLDVAEAAQTVATAAQDKADEVVSVQPGG